MKQLKYQIWSKHQGSKKFYLYKEFNNCREAAETISNLTRGTEDNCTFKIKIIAYDN